jgi:molybdopterin biosynthesis enzyme
MSQANCFIVLPTDTANVGAGETVEVQVLEGLI